MKMTKLDASGDVAQARGVRQKGKERSARSVFLLGHSMTARPHWQSAAALMVKDDATEDSCLYDYV